MAEKIVHVRQDGTGDFATVQAAVDAIPAGNPDRVVIAIAPGTYKERITVGKDKPHLTFRGTDAKTTVLTWFWNAGHIGPDGKAVGSGGSYSTRVAANDFTAERITFENTAGETGQALAMSATGDRQVYRECRFLGWQDTLYADGGRQYYDRCYVEGRVDFIFGGATAVFDRCTIHSKNGGYVTAASTKEGQPYGYVFLDCELTGEGSPALLGRPWRPHAMVAFVRCKIGGHIKPAGWDNWRKVENEATARYYEHDCTGPGADRAGRVKWARTLDAAAAAEMTPRKIMAGADGWDPTNQRKEGER